MNPTLPEGWLQLNVCHRKTRQGRLLHVLVCLVSCWELPWEQCRGLMMITSLHSAHGSTFGSPIPSWRIQVLCLRGREVPESHRRLSSYLAITAVLVILLAKNMALYCGQRTVFLFLKSDKFWRMVIYIDEKENSYGIKCFIICKILTWNFRSSSTSFYFYLYMMHLLRGFVFWRVIPGVKLNSHLK